MKAPYVVGELRKCADCGKEFERGPHRKAYCRPCQNRRNQESAARCRLKREQTGQPPPPKRSFMKPSKEKAVRETHRTLLPFCPYCHRYGGMCEHREVVYG